MDAIRKIIGKYAANAINSTLSYYFTGFDAHNLANDFASGNLQIRNLTLKPHIMNHAFTGIDVNSCVLCIL